MLCTVAEPSYNAEWEIIDAGEDLSKSSPTTANIKDLLWATVILMLLAGVTDYAWLLALFMPVYAGYAMFGKLLGPMMGLGGGTKGGTQEESDSERKKREKTEKRAEKRRVKRF